MAALRSSPFCLRVNVCTASKSELQLLWLGSADKASLLAGLRGRRFALHASWVLPACRADLGRLLLCPLPMFQWIAGLLNGACVALLISCMFPVLAPPTGEFV